MEYEKIAIINKKALPIKIDYISGNVNISFGGEEFENYKLSAEEYNIFKQIDGETSLKNFKDTNIQKTFELIKKLEDDNIITLSPNLGLKRYSKESDFVGKKFYKKVVQNNIANKKVLIIGCGDSSSKVATSLVDIGVNKFVVWDYERSVDTNSDYKLFTNKNDNDCDWRLSNMEKSIKKGNFSKKVDLIRLPFDSNNFDVVVNTNLLDDVDFAFVFSDINETPILDSYDLLTELKIPYISVECYGDTIIYGPMITYQDGSIEKFLLDNPLRINSSDVEKHALKPVLKSLNILPTIVVGEFIHFFLDREECKTINKKIFVDCSKFRLYEYDLNMNFSKKNKLDVVLDVNKNDEKIQVEIDTENYLVGIVEKKKSKNKESVKKSQLEKEIKTDKKMK